jgi:putative Mg2+ transporter-C (MgtC) family protein
VGACTGTGMVAEATLLTCFVLAGNTLLRPLVNMINRIPIDDRSTEATYEVSVISSREAMPQMRDLLVERLEAADYPVSDVEITDRGNNTVEIVATLVSTAVDPHEIEAVTSYLEQQKGVSDASWDGSTRD